jgi:hypothetical protein
MLLTHESSPNTDLIRKGNAVNTPIESEYHPHSDWKCCKHSNQVRIPPPFRLEMLLTPQSSPNTTPIQTGNAVNTQTKSESPPIQTRNAVNTRIESEYSKKVRKHKLVSAASYIPKSTTTFTTAFFKNKLKEIT